MVQDEAQSTIVFSTTKNVLGWTHQYIDFIPWRGQAITLAFKLYQTEHEPYSWVYLDEVSLGSARPDVWIEGAHVEGLPGEQVIYPILYGNQGSGTASAVRITNTLPSEMSFVSASIPPVSTNPALVWSVGTLAPQSGPFEIVVTATLASTATAFSTLTHTLEIAPQNMGLSGTIVIDPGLVELETANNLANSTIFVGKHVFLPVILKEYRP